MRSFIHTTLVMLVAVVTTACKEPNPDFCCVTAEQCAELGGPEIRPCRAGQACRAGGCVASECDTSADCTDAANPVCINNLCEASCKIDADCAGSAAGSRCASDGVCVGCTADDQCPSNAAFCDKEDRSCRGCEADVECTEGVCLEADGRCTAESEVVFLTAAGQDTGECGRTQPCRTFPYALSKVRFPNRPVMHIDDGSLALPADITIDVPMYLDASDTSIIGDGSGPYFTVTALGSGSVTLSNVQIAPSSGPAISVASASSLRVFGSTINAIVTTGGAINAVKSRFSGFTTIDALSCTNGTLSVTSCELIQSSASSINCQVTVSASVFEVNGASALRASGGHIAFENNLVVQADGFGDSVFIGGAAPGSVVRFSTFVNTSSLGSNGVALECDSTLDVTSNVFAYASMRPHGNSSCQARYSVYDAIALPQQTDGIGNQVVDGATIFRNRLGRDFHLSATSPARATGEPGADLRSDLEGARRPNPIGSNPDVGAYEAP